MNRYNAFFAVVVATIFTGLYQVVKEKRRRVYRTRLQSKPSSGGTLIADTLRAHGVKQIFALCGGHISPILVACNKIGIRVIDVRDEASAVFAADAVSRLSSIPGVAAVTAGPGLTNTLTAVKNAQCAQSPLVLFTGSPPTLLQGKGALQDVDQVSLMEPHVKKFFRCRKVKDIVSSVQEAFRIAREGVPGVVCVECPVDILYSGELVSEWYLSKSKRNSLIQRITTWYLTWYIKKMHAVDEETAAVGLPLPYKVPVHSSTQLRKVYSMLAKSKRPLVILGSQTVCVSSTVVSASPSCDGEDDPGSSAERHVAQLANALRVLNVPVYLTGMARGLLGSESAIQLYHKRREACKEADMVLLLGIACDFRLDYGQVVPAKTPLVCVNRSKKDLKLGVRRPDVCITADPGNFLLSLAGLHQKKLDISPPRKEWLDGLKSRDRAAEEQIVTQSLSVSLDHLYEKPAINPLALLRLCQLNLPLNTILIGDGGDFVAAAAYVVKPRGPLCWLDPGVFGTLGVGGGFAVGAAAVRPTYEVCIIYGDGSCGYSLAEFDTFVRHKLPVYCIVGNNAVWAQIERDQVKVLHDSVGCMLAFTNYHTVAVGYGGNGTLVKELEDVVGALKAASRNAQRLITSSPQSPPTPTSTRATAGCSCINVIIGRMHFRDSSISV